MFKRIKKGCVSQKGQSLVEFALVLPVFIVILCGIVEFGRLWETVNIITSAAREGARTAAVSAPNISRATYAAQNVLTAANIEGAQISVTGPTSADEVVVTVSVAYRPITGALVPNLGTISLSRSTTMRWEG